MDAGSAAPDTARMESSVPFCEECGRLGPRLTGVHPSDAGVVRWTLYRCGHMKTEIVLDAAHEDVGRRGDDHAVPMPASDLMPASEGAALP